MHDFDATNLLSDEKHSDYGNPFDKTYFYKGDNEKIERKHGKLEGAKHERKHDKMWTQSATGKLSESTKNFKNINKKHVTKSSITTENFKSTSKQDDNAKATSKINEKETETLTSLKGHVHRGVISMKTLISGTTATANIETKSKLSHSGYASDDDDMTVNDAQINTSFDLSGDDTIMYAKAPKDIMKPGYSHNVESRNILGGEGTTTGAPPYITVLTSSVAVLGVVIIILFIILLYKHRHKSAKPVISDEMYNAYKLSKTMAARSPLPSPRGSEQEDRREYDFVAAESLSAHLTWETTVSQEPGESVYLELDDDSRYDYATAPDTPD